MPEGNGNDAKAALERLQARVDEHDTGIKELKSVIRNLSDAMVVHAHLERKQSEAIAALNERGDNLDARVSKLVAAIGDLISRIPPTALG